MRFAAMVSTRLSLLRNNAQSIPLLADSFRLKRQDYEAECRGLKFSVRANCGEWYTIFENVVREDYFQNGITVRPGDTVIDIGANFGAFTAVAARKVGATGKVISFEPNPAVCTRLTRTVALNSFEHVRIFGDAVSDRDGEVAFYVHTKSAFSSLLATMRENESVKQILVRSRSINDVIGELGVTVDLLKMDCEGAEYAILDALSEDMARRIKQISMEMHEVPDRQLDEIPTRLRKLGFDVRCTYTLLTASS